MAVGGLYGAVAELVCAVGAPIASVGQPIVGAAMSTVSTAVQALCGGERQKGSESHFLAAVRVRGEPHWTELQELLDEEVEEIFLALGLDAEQKVSVPDFQGLKGRLLARGGLVQEDVKVVLERFDRRPYERTEEVDLGEVKLVFHLVLQARTDVLCSTLRGDLAPVWQRVGDNSCGLVDMQALHAHARSYAARLPARGFHFFDDDVSELVDRWAHCGRAPLEPREFNALMQELYFELLMMAWLASAAARNTAPYGRDEVPAPMELPSLRRPCSRRCGDNPSPLMQAACYPVVS